MKKTIFHSFILLVCLSFSCVYGCETPFENDEACNKFLQMRITNDEDRDKFEVIREYLGPHKITTKITCYQELCEGLTIKLLSTIKLMDEVALREIERYRRSDDILSSDSECDDSDSDDSTSNCKLSPHKKKNWWFSRLILQPLKRLFW